jgi:hypothetical protein
MSVEVFVFILLIQASVACVHNCDCEEDLIFCENRGISELPPADGDYDPDVKQVSVSFSPFGHSPFPLSF